MSVKGFPAYGCGCGPSGKNTKKSNKSHKTNKSHKSRKSHTSR